MLPSTDFLPPGPMPMPKGARAGSGLGLSASTGSFSFCSRGTADALAKGPADEGRRHVSHHEEENRGHRDPRMREERELPPLCLCAQEETRVQTSGWPACNPGRNSLSHETHCLHTSSLASSGGRAATSTEPVRLLLSEDGLQGPMIPDEGDVHT